MKMNEMSNFDKMGFSQCVQPRVNIALNTAFNLIEERFTLVIVELTSKNVNPGLIYIMKCQFMNTQDLLNKALMCSHCILPLKDKDMAPLSSINNTGSFTYLQNKTRITKTG